MKIRICWVKEKSLFAEGVWQEKTFENERAAMEWCRIHSKNILYINNTLFLDEQISHFDIVDALNM